MLPSMDVSSHEPLAPCSGSWPREASGRGTAYRCFSQPEADISTMEQKATRLLYDREESARQLSISVRSLDYFIAAKRITVRRVGRKVLIPHSELVRFARADHFGPVRCRRRKEADSVEAAGTLSPTTSTSAGRLPSEKEAA